MTNEIYLDDDNDDDVSDPDGKKNVRNIRDRR